MPAFCSLEAPAHRAKRGLIVAILVAVVSLVADFQQWSLTKRIAAHDATLHDITVNDRIQAALGLAQLVTFLLAAILFLRWFHRAYANLRALGADGLPHGPGWAVGYWFVPIINLVRPATVACDIWNASDPGADPVSWRRRKHPAFVLAWWLTFLLAGIITRAGVQLWNGADDPTALRQAAIVFLVADVFFLVAGTLAVTFVRRTTARQQRRASSLQLLTPAHP
jgi:heme/copper-type cytochrome/quinol oxidase subunit 2